MWCRPSIGQALAARRPELLRALVLSNTAPRLGAPYIWAAGIAADRAGGVASIADAVLERWFAPPVRTTPALHPWRNMLARCDAQGYIAACEAIAAADLTEAAAGEMRDIEIQEILRQFLGAEHHLGPAGAGAVILQPDRQVQRLGQ
ncbi:hypothetical protein VB636_10040, partial [Paracoccus sp. APAP_BH8]